MKIRIFICYVLAGSIAISGITFAKAFAKAVVEDDQVAVSLLQAKAMVGEVPVLFVSHVELQEVNISDEYVAIVRPAVFSPINQERPPPAVKVRLLSYIV